MKQVDKLIRIVLLIIACCMGELAYADTSSFTVVKGGIVYKIFEDSNPYAEVEDVLEDAGTDIRFPEKIKFDGKEYPVTGWTYETYTVGVGTPSTHYCLRWTNKNIRSLYLPKTMSFVIMYGNMEEIKSSYDNWPALEEVIIDPASEWYASYEGGVYSSSSINRYARLEFIPRQCHRDGVVSIHPKTERISSAYAIYNNENMKCLIVPETVVEIYDECIMRNKNLRKVVFKGKYNHRLIDDNDNTNLREIEWRRCPYNTITFPYRQYPNLVKLSRFIDTKEVYRGYSEGYSNIMLFDLPDIKRLDANDLGRPQAVIIGDSHNPEDTQVSEIDENWLDPETPVIVSLNSIQPLKVKLSNNWSYAKLKKWTIYVPTDLVEAYESDEYWGSVGEIFPITDKLIPLVSEPELEIKPGMNHEYLWDVMPLGDAVAAERGEWTSDDPSVATVDEDGVLSAVSLGEATITFTLADTAGNLYTAESKVSVVKELSGVEEIEDESVVVTPEISVPDGVYDLHGRRVGDTPDGLAPGLYIVRHQGKTEKRLVR
ncbi:MAG: hypothetical protein HDR95_09335 [Bacteroides sp.]|nr:hypothetical protein [Bacteroides sp.]